jgi:hypothetical protein
VKVVSLVDMMPQRGAADALIAPLRPRLAALAPIRPLHLNRVMFQPLDPVIVEARDWRPDSPSVPRTALGCLGAAVLRRIDPSGESLRPMAAAVSAAEAAAIWAKAGALLWPAAAACLAELPAPSDWTHGTGLPLGCFDIVRARVVAVLRQGLRLQALDRADPDDARQLVRLVVAETQTQRPDSLDLMLAVLMARHATATLAVASGLPPASVEAALGQSLRRAERLMDAVGANVDLGTAATHVHEVADLLDALDGSGGRSALRGQARRTRQTAESACRDRLASAVQREFLPNLLAPAIDDAAVVRLEDRARTVRRFGLAARRLGGPAACESLLEQAIGDVRDAPSDSLSSMDRLRLGELLGGADAALRLMPGLAGDIA